MANFTAPITDSCFGLINSTLGANFLTSFFTIPKTIFDLNTPPANTNGNFLFFKFNFLIF